MIHFFIRIFKLNLNMSNKPRIEENNPAARGNSFVLDFGSEGSPFSSVVVEPEDVEDEIEDGEEEEVEDSVEESEETESEDGEESEESEEQEVDDEDDINVYYHIGKELQADSFLPEDFEISEDVDPQTLKESIKQKLREEMEPAIKSEVYQNLVEMGYSEQDLVIARALRQGVDPKMLSAASMYETMATMPDDSDAPTKRSVISQMYRARGFNDREIETLVKTAEEDDTVDLLYKESRQFFKGKYDLFLEEQEKIAKEREDAARQQSREANEKINAAIRERKILDLEMTPEQAKQFEDAIRKQDQIVEVNGQKYRASEIQDFLYRFQADDTMKLYAFFLYKFKDEFKNSAKKVAKKEVEEDFLKGYQQRMIKKARATKNKKTVKKEPMKSVGNTYILDMTPKNK